ncbi:MAG: hypothetical protein HZA17_05135 [Nitrospirae bacterium]|nr:hypothetical protein [Nitrospirota bacterium]
MINAAYQLKYKKYLWGLVAVFLCALFYVAGYHYYINHIKYRELEQRLIQIHSEMRRDIPEESWGKMEHFGVGLSIRNYYNLWDEKSELRQLFEKNGVFHPDDMAALIMETFVRAQRGVHFRLHRLIQLQSDVYKAKDNQAYLMKMADEFLIYKNYKEQLRRTNQSSRQ